MYPLPQGSGWAALLPVGVLVPWAVCQESTEFAYGASGAPSLCKLDLPARAAFRVQVPTAKVTVLSPLFALHPLHPRAAAYPSVQGVYRAAGPTCLKELVISWTFSIGTERG